MGFIETYKNQIQRLCESHKVKTLYAFGSVNTEKFTQDSDVDLVVDFKIDDPIEYTNNYFDLKFELERILNRQIDLLENKAIRNPFLKESIDKTKVLLYG
ncbi:nucleotidyltransferase domain-containing protein [Oscillatoria amoena NRMC-F 0135]|nr:nucleotidyltransferase domain-containing protein [Oscillatoria amoena NRMC-F 0135]